MDYVYSDPFLLLKEELKEDDPELIVSAINRIDTVALSIGPERTRDELLPYLENFEETNDEARTIISEKLGNFLELVGGTGYVSHLLKILGNFAMSEETVLREMAVFSLTKIIQQISDEDLITNFLPILRKLTEGNWYSSRCSSCALFSPSYSRLTPDLKDEMRKRYSQLLNDDTPMVRICAFNHLSSYSSYLTKDEYLQQCIPALKALLDDGSDNIRLLSVPSLVNIIKTFSVEEYRDHFYPILDAISEDVSWRVRRDLAKQLPTILSSLSIIMGFDFHNKDVNSQPSNYHLEVIEKVFKLVKSLSSDNESEVRTAIIDQFSHCCQFAPSNLIMKYLCPILDALAHDPIQQVKIAFSEQICQISPYLEQEANILYVLPVIVILMKDEDFEVKFRVLDYLHIITPVVGADKIVQSILPVMFDLVNDPKWRVRLAVISKLGVIGSYFPVEFFDSHLKRLLFDGLSDSVFSIRKQSITQLISFIEYFGIQWASTTIIPSVMNLYESASNYLHRMVPLYFMMQISQKDLLKKDQAIHLFLPILLKSCEDTVINVRFFAAKTISELLHTINYDIIKSKIKPVLEKMMNDNDPDVVYFSTKCYNQCQNLDTLNT